MLNLPVPGAHNWHTALNAVLAELQGRTDAPDVADNVTDLNGAGAHRVNWFYGDAAHRPWDGDGIVLVFGYPGDVGRLQQFAIEAERNSANFGHGRLATRTYQAGSWSPWRVFDQAGRLDGKMNAGDLNAAPLGFVSIVDTGGIANKPIGFGNGLLETVDLSPHLGGNPTQLQRFTEYDFDKFAIRYGYNGAWSPWRIYYPNRDSGNRDIRSLLGVGRTANRMRLRRIGNTCTLELAWLNWTGTGYMLADQIMPAGFRMGAGSAFIPIREGVATGVFQHLDFSDGGPYAYFASDPGYGWFGTITYLTADPWPDSLPGVAL